MFSNDSVETDPFPFDGQPIVATPSHQLQVKRKTSYKVPKKSSLNLPRRSSPVRFEFSDDESQSLAQLAQERAKFEEAAKKLTKAMTENTACMNR